MSINVRELSPIPAKEAGLCYTQQPGRDAEFGCVGHMRFEPGSELRFGSEWVPHVPDLETDELWKEFQTVLDELRLHGPLQDPRATVEFCERHPEAVIPGDIGMRGFRLDGEYITCYVRCSTIPRGNSYIYLYDKDTLNGFLERNGPDITEQIKVTAYGEMCEFYPGYAQDAAAIQAAVPGLIGYAATLAVQGREDEIPELREYLIHMTAYMLTSAETDPNVTDMDWADKKYGEMVDKAVAAARETGKVPEMSGKDAEAVYTGLDLYIKELMSDGEYEDRVEQSGRIAAGFQQEWPSAADHPELFAVQQANETELKMGGM